MQNKRVSQALENLTGDLPANKILDVFKELLISESIFQGLFGANGERVIIGKVGNINNTNIPLMILRHKSERYTSLGGYANGEIEGRILLHPTYRDETDMMRKLSGLLVRFLGSDNFYEIFNRVKGLTEFNNFNFQYLKLYNLGQDVMPAITFSCSYQIDMGLWSHENPDIDWSEPLDGEAFDIASYFLTFSVDDDSEDQLKDVIKEDRFLEVRIEDE